MHTHHTRRPSRADAPGPCDDTDADCAPARGIVWGVLIAVVAFWAPLAAGIYALTRR